MKSFYALIRLLESLGYSSQENEKIYSISFRYDERIKELLKYDNLLGMKSNFPKCLSLYIHSSLNNEINILDFLEDKDEFEEELNNRKDGSFEYKLIFNKKIFISNIDIPNNCIARLYINRDTLISDFNKDIRTIEEVFFDKDKKSIFILGYSNIFFRNDIFMVTNLQKENFQDDIVQLSNEGIVNNEVVAMRNEYCNWMDGTHYLTPESLYIDFKKENFVCDYDFKSVICKKTVDLIIPFLSNFTGMVDGELISIINGNKRIEIVYDLDIKNYNLESYELLFKLYRWIYENSTFDKIRICRNVISVLISAKCQGSTYKTMLDNCDWLVKSVQDNFEEFLQKNIESYFKEKNTIIDKLSENISSINNQISEITKFNITNVTSLLGTAIAAVVGYIAKGEYTFIRMLSFLYLSFLIINSIFNLPISIIRAIQARIDFSFNKKLYIKLYLDDERITRMVKRNNFNYSVFWVYMISSFILIIIITVFLINTDINEFIKNFK